MIHGRKYGTVLSGFEKPAASVGVLGDGVRPDFARPNLVRYNPIRPDCAGSENQYHRDRAYARKTETPRIEMENFRVWMGYFYNFEGHRG